MPEVVHPRELEQDVEAADEGARSSSACVLVHQNRGAEAPPLPVSVRVHNGRDNGTRVLFGTNA
jgi:hypothetical protein